MSSNAAVPAPEHTINLIRVRDRDRDDILRAEGDLTRRVKARCRTAAELRFTDTGKVREAKMKEAARLYDAIAAETDDVEILARVGSAIDLMAARKSLTKRCSGIETDIRKQVKTLPVHKTFVQHVPGFGELGLGQIISQCGDLSCYANPAKVWKRMGLGLVDGERQRKHQDAAKAIAHGYSPRRRATMYVIGDSLIKKQNTYREIYLARKVFEAVKSVAAGKPVLDAAAVAKQKPKAGTYMSAMHVHLRAQRYVEKRLLRDLWRAWVHEHGIRPPPVQA